MTKIKPMLAVGAALLLTLPTLPLAGGHSPIEERQASMKEVGKATKTIGDMVKGETSFDADQVAASLENMKAALEGFEQKFPEGSTGGDSTAAPAIWSQNAEFVSKVSAFRSSIDAAIEANPTSLDAVRASFGNVAQNCRGCHETFRIKKS